jgi:uncharacterized cupredoxin-like copper-binding protein
MKRWLALLLALVAGGATVAIGYALDDAASADTHVQYGPGLRTVRISIQYSKFSTDEIHVVAGQTVRFVVRNDDPINHEFIVGDASVHLRHERGTESAHPPVPGEVSIGPNDTGVTVYTFERSGRYLFACHLPEHFAFGMRGYVVVDPARAT